MSNTDKPQDAALDQMAAHWDIDPATGRRAELSHDSCKACDGTGKIKVATRCEPPPEFRDKKFHWLTHDGSMEPFFRQTDGNWLCTGSEIPDTPETLASLGWSWDSVAFPVCIGRQVVPTAELVRDVVEKLPRGTIWHTQLSELVAYTKLALAKFRGPPS